MKRLKRFFEVVNWKAVLLSILAFANVSILVAIFTKYRLLDALAFCAGVWTVLVGRVLLDIFRNETKQ